MGFGTGISDFSLKLNRMVSETSPNVKIWIIYDRLLEVSYFNFSFIVFFTSIE